MNIFDCTWTLTWSDQRISGESWFKTNSTNILLIVSYLGCLDTNSPWWFYLAHFIDFLLLFFFMFLFLFHLFHFLQFFLFYFSFILLNLVVQIFISGFWDSDWIVGDDYRFSHIGWNNLPDSHLLLSHLKDISFSDRIFANWNSHTFLGKLLTISQRGLWTSPYFSW